MRAVAFLALAISIVAAPGCRPAKPVEAQGVVPELKLEGVRFRVYRGDSLRSFGEAANVSLRRDSTDVVARDLLATLPRGGAPPVRIAAPAGEGVISSRLFSASGGLTVSRGGDVGRTERARYVPAADGERVLGDDPVLVEGKGYRLMGSRFALDPAAGELTLLGGARLVAGLAGPGGAR